MGFEIEYFDDGSIGLHNRDYIQQLLASFNYTGCRPYPTPMQANVRRGPSDCPSTQAESDDMRHVPYRSLLGGFQWLANMTRPDIATACSIFGQFSANPGHRHWQGLQLVVRYLSGTAHHGIIYRCGHPNGDMFVSCSLYQLEHRR